MIVKILASCFIPCQLLDVKSTDNASAGMISANLLKLDVDDGAK